MQTMDCSNQATITRISLSLTPKWIRENFPILELFFFLMKPLIRELNRDNLKFFNIPLQRPYHSS